MEKIVVMTDGSRGLRPQTYRGFDIHVIPMPVIINNEGFYEGWDLSCGEFYQLIFNRGAGPYHRSAWPTR